MTIELGVIISVASITIAFLGYQSNKQKQATDYQKTIRNDATREAVIETKLDSISLGVENIRIDLRASESRIGELNMRLTRTEESAKQAHKRIDKIEEKGVEK
jgi:molybdopterin-biosynthesis enzyme MoeA-like protein